MLATQSCLILGDPMDCSLPSRLLCPWNSPGKNLEWVAIPFERDLPNPGIEPKSLSLLHRRQILYHLSHRGSPAVTEYCSQ